MISNVPTVGLRFGSCIEKQINWCNFFLNHWTVDKSIVGTAGGGNAVDLKTCPPSGYTMSGPPRGHQA